ncbi:uncharacterized protein LOC134271291 [Saccostrea cucullata]|uniref:uncharacterized protein LOC134271291 n=1 Tax=Saccostrea cuccullata TaxID=36930 RepID=UPI002ED30A2C
MTSSETGDPGDSLAVEAEEGTTTVGTPGGFDDILSPLPGGGGFAEIFPPMVGEDGGFSPPSSNWGLQRGGTEVMGGFVMEGNHDDSRKVDFLQLTCDFDGVPCDWHTRLDWSVRNEKLGSISEEGINQTGNYLFSQENLRMLSTFTSHIVREPNKYGSFCLSFTFYKSNRSGLLAVYLLDHETQDMNQIWKEDAPSKSWRRAHVNISTSREFMILIEAEHDGDNTVIAIDDIAMTNMTCAVRQDLPAVPPQPIADLFPSMPDDMAIPEFPDISGLPAELPSRQPGNLPEETGGMKFPEFLDRRGRPESTLFQ